MSHFAYYINAKVRQDGRIFPWGGFRITTSKNDDPADNDSGLFCWCEELIEYPNQTHAVHIVTDYLLVTERSTNDEIDQFALYGDVVQVFVPCIQFVEIDAAGKIRFLQNEEVVEDQNFFSFDLKYAGLKVVKLAFHGHLKPLKDTKAEDYLVFTLDGEKVPFCFNAAS